MRMKGSLGNKMLILSLQKFVLFMLDKKMVSTACLKQFEICTV
jgi:hypothetical protein